jgi:predicted component of viral defense system (DUF524 family)
MPGKKITIPIAIANGNIELVLYSEQSEGTLIEKSDALENGEALFQIKEGFDYEYKITTGFNLKSSEIVIQSKVNDSSGRVSPNIYVGTLNIDVLDANNNKCGEVKLEVQSVKTTYREDYRHMLEEITEKCTDLLLRHNSPVSQHFEVDFNVEAKTLYQRFAFIKSILDSNEFSESVHKIISAPVTRWKVSEAIKDVRQIKRFNNSALKQLGSSCQRIELPISHPLKRKLASIPLKIKNNYKTETSDVSENRFVKHALLFFQVFCGDFKAKIKDNSRIKNEAGLLVDKLEQLLSHSFFKEISNPTTIPLNSPVLQRKEGYREILRVWLMFDLAAKMIWHGGDDIYSGNKRDVAVLYEYWLFFKLLDIIAEVFRINSLAVEQLIEETSDGLGLKLKQGKFLPIEGVYNSDTRKLRIEFSYNKTFSGDNKYPASGSWTRNLRPDYTLSIWPFGIEQEQAEREELIVHIHFDAKYKIEDFQTIFSKEENLDEEKKEQKKGTYKRADLLKMHTYRDAIRRTGGAYILYPGTVSYNKPGFHEVLPGLGAFAITPTKSNNGIEELKSFLNEVVTHFLNRTSQREKVSLKTYEIYKNSTKGELNAALPETYGENRGLNPDEIFVLIAYYKKENWDWMARNGLYNARADDARGSLKLGLGETSARFLLLHSDHETKASKLLKVTETGPRIFSKQTLIAKGYPSLPSQNYYLVYKFEKPKEPEFLNKKWDITKLRGYKTGRGSALPVAVTLTELMKVLVK